MNVLYGESSLTDSPGTFVNLPTYNRQAWISHTINIIRKFCYLMRRPSEDKSTAFENRCTKEACNCLSWSFENTDDFWRRLRLRDDIVISSMTFPNRSAPSANALVFKTNVLRWVTLVLRLSSRVLRLSTGVLRLRTSALSNGNAWEKRSISTYIIIIYADQDSKATFFRLSYHTATTELFILSSREPDGVLIRSRNRTQLYRRTSFERGNQPRP